jgi:hypothetical protein
MLEDLPGLTASAKATAVRQSLGEGGKDPAYTTTIWRVRKDPPYDVTASTICRDEMP